MDFIIGHERFPQGLDLWVRGNTHNATCMHLACCRPQLPVAKFLVTHSKCPRDLINWGNKHSATCLHLACEDAHLTVVEFLVTDQRCREEKLILQQNKNGFTCLHLAIQKVGGRGELLCCGLWTEKMGGGASRVTGSRRSVYVPPQIGSSEKHLYNSVPQNGRFSSGDNGIP